MAGSSLSCGAPKRSGGPAISPVDWLDRTCCAGSGVWWFEDPQRVLRSLRRDHLYPIELRPPGACAEPLGSSARAPGGGDQRGGVPPFARVVPKEGARSTLLVVGASGQSADRPTWPRRRRAGQRPYRARSRKPCSGVGIPPLTAF